jgi:electron transfer flavoprotein beta subunit
LRIVVCIKIVPDSEAPPSAFSVEEPNEVIVADYVPWLVGPYDESAIEAALRLKETYGAEVILLCFGSEDYREKLVESLGTGADRAVLIADRNTAHGDSFRAAYALSRGIDKIGGVDLVLCGRQASDTDAGAVGPCLASLLNFACATIIKSIDSCSEKLVIQQQIDEGGCRVLEVALPAVLSVTSENYTLRYASLANIMAAMEKDFEIWELSDLGLDGDSLCEQDTLTSCIRAEAFDPKVECKIITGNDEEEVAINLFAELKRSNPQFG